MKIQEYINNIENGKYDKIFEKLYKPEKVSAQKARCRTAVRKFSEHYPGREDIHVYSAPGRTEIGGNHTDHQHGCVIAGAVDLDMIGVVSFHSEGVLRVWSEGYEPFEVSLSDLRVHSDKKSSSELIRGIAAQFDAMGVNIDGFDIYITSDVLIGSGISSSAAFEILISYIIDSYYNGGRSGAAGIAKIGQYAENIYFGKSSGLMDQLACSLGGMVFIDFIDAENPCIRRFDHDFKQAGYTLVITDTKGDHSCLTDDYTAVRSEMEDIAGYFGKKALREVDEAEFIKNIPDIRKKNSDRAVLRAVHFFDENRRAREEFEALSENRFDDFLKLADQSGDSSANLLQNLYSCASPAEQGIPLAIMLSRKILNGRGAVRVHGGGFAGTVQAFVPNDAVSGYTAEMERVFGENSCYVLSVRMVGSIEII